MIIGEILGKKTCKIRNLCAITLSPGSPTITFLQVGFQTTMILVGVYNHPKGINNFENGGWLPGCLLIPPKWVAFNDCRIWVVSFWLTVHPCYPCHPAHLRRPNTMFQCRLKWNCAEENAHTCVLEEDTPPKFEVAPLKNDGLSFWDVDFFQGPWKTSGSIPKK